VRTIMQMQTEDSYYVVQNEEYHIVNCRWCLNKYIVLFKHQFICATMKRWFWKTTFVNHV